MVKIKADLENIKVYLHLKCNVNWSLKKEKVRRDGLGFVL